MLDTKENFYFHGESGCDRCSALTGLYEHFPERPHPHCDCVVEQRFGQTGQGPVIERELRRVTSQVYRWRDYRPGIFVFGNDTGRDVTVQHACHETVEGYDELPEALEEACFGEAPPTTGVVTSDIVANILQDCGFMVDLRVEFYHLDASAEVWVKDNDTGEWAFEEMVTGRYEFPEYWWLEVWGGDETSEAIPAEGRF